MINKKVVESVTRLLAEDAQIDPVELKQMIVIYQIKLLKRIATSDDEFYMLRKKFVL